MASNFLFIDDAELEQIIDLGYAGYYNSIMRQKVCFEQIYFPFSIYGEFWINTDKKRGHYCLQGIGSPNMSIGVCQRSGPDDFRIDFGRDGIFFDEDKLENINMIAGAFYDSCFDMIALSPFLAYPVSVILKPLGYGPSHQYVCLRARGLDSPIESDKVKEAASAVDSMLQKKAGDMDFIIRGSTSGDSLLAEFTIPDPQRIDLANLNELMKDFMSVDIHQLLRA